MMRTHRAFLLVEVIGASAIVMLAAAITWYALTQYAVVRDEIDLRRSVRLAALAEIARQQAFAPASAAAVETSIDVSVTIQPGVGAWSGLERVAVRAVGRTRRGRLVESQLAVYRVPMRGAE
ncbi:MAG: hypothetical protein JNG88_10710 [Phycisphaerales bacterium]|nr:hypothetical protein [Phycisphaerales bacterium]